MLDVVDVALLDLDTVGGLQVALAILTPFASLFMTDLSKLVHLQPRVVFLHIVGSKDLVVATVMAVTECIFVDVVLGQ